MTKLVIAKAEAATTRPIIAKRMVFIAVAALAESPLANADEVSD